MDRTIELTHKDIKLWRDGEADLTINLKAVDPAAPLPDNINQLFNIQFNVAGGRAIAIGAPGNMKLGIKGGTSAHLMPIRAGQNGDAGRLLEAHGLKEFFLSPQNANMQLLALRLGASAGATATGTFPYSVLSVKGTLEAGGDVGYDYIKPYRKSTPAGEMVRDLLGGLRLPADAGGPLEPGEVIAYSFGGYLNVGVGLTVGYEMQGTKDFNIGKIDLSEVYKLSVLGKLDLNGKVAGSYSVEVRGTGRDSWVQVVVRRTRSSEFGVAAHVGVEVLGELKGLPANGREFLGAALGVNVKNWFNVLDKARELTDLDNLEQKLGGLAKDFIEEWVGKAFNQVPAPAKAVLKKIHDVVEAYNNLDNNAITLFDRYFDRLGLLTDQLDKLKKLASFEELTGEADGELWNVLRQLTGGDPLGFIAEQSVDALKSRVQQVLDLIEKEAYKEIRTVIEVAKRSFPLDGFIRDLATVDTIAELRALAGKKLGNFAERLIGKALAELKNSGETKEAVHAIQDIVKAAQKFESGFDNVLKAAAKQTVAAKLAASYSKASETEALVDIEINLAHPKGTSLLRSATQGDFREALCAIQPDAVKINKGVFTHEVTRNGKFLVNIIGWHRNWSYSSFHTLMLKTEQQMAPNSNGLITVYTTIEMGKEQERRMRNEERVYTHFVFRLAGESNGLVPKDGKRVQYLIEAITAMSATYQLWFTDKKTEPEELDDYLSFAREFGLDKVGATPDQVRRMLPMKDGNFGEVSARYDVRFSEEGLNLLFRGGLKPGAVRGLMRKMVLANYLKRGPYLGDIAWCYATQEVHDFKARSDNDGPRFDTLSSFMWEDLSTPIPGIEPPSRVTLTSNALVRVLNTLIEIENRFVGAFQDLQALLKAREERPAEVYEKDLYKFGDALKKYDDFDQGENTVFAVMDGMIRAAGGDAIRNCSLSLESKVDGETVTKNFVLVKAAPALVRTARIA